MVNSSILYKKIIKKNKYSHSFCQCLDHSMVRVFVMFRICSLIHKIVLGNSLTYTSLYIYTYILCVCHRGFRISSPPYTAFSCKGAQKEIKKLIYHVTIYYH